MLDDNGKVIKKIGVCMDITPQKELQQNLQSLNDSLKEKVDQEVRERFKVIEEKKRQDELFIRQSKMAAMGEILEVITHQWKQPLTVISLTTSELEFQSNNPTAVSSLQGKIYNQVEFLSNTIKEFTKFFNTQQKDGVFPVAEEIDNIIKIMGAPLARQNHMKIEFTSDRINCLVKGSTNEFKHVILNLLSNAKDACRETRKYKGKIRISINKHLETLQVIVNDNCGGIPEHFLPDALFEPHCTSKGENGSGIGLSISKTIIERNHSPTRPQSKL